jgi:hypothetical protein
MTLPSWHRPSGVLGSAERIRVSISLREAAGPKHEDPSVLFDHVDNLACISGSCFCPFWRVFTRSQPLVCRIAQEQDIHLGRAGQLWVDPRVVVPELTDTLEALDEALGFALEDRIAELKEVHSGWHCHSLFQPRCSRAIGAA